MEDQYKTKEQLINELAELRHRMTELEKSEAERKQMEEALQFTRFSVDNAAETMVCVDHDGRFIDVNNAFCRSSGYSREELLSMIVHDIDPDYSAEVWPEFWKKLKQSGSLTFESYHRSKEGRIFPVEITANFFEYNGKEYHCSFARDITERKRAEEALRESEERYRNLVESISDVVYAIDSNGVLTYISPIVKNTLGYEPDELIGRQFLEFVHKEDHDLLMGRFSELRKGIVRQGDYRVIGKHGDIKWVRTLTNPIIEEGGFVGARGVLIDITERKQAEEALKKGEERFRTSVEALLEGFAILSAVRDSHSQIIDFKYDYINEAGCKMNQKPHEEHMSKTLLELLPTHKEIGLFDEYVRVVETGQQLTKEFLIYEGVYGGGLQLRQCFDVRITRLGDGLVTTWQDLTDKKKREELFRRGEERLRLLIENSKDIVIMADLEGNIMYYNGPTEYGITAEEVLGKNPFSIFEPVIAARLMNQLKLVIKNGEALPFENGIPLKGKSYWFLNQMYPIWDEKGGMIAVGLIARNITERKQAEEETRKLLVAIQQEKERLSGLVNSITDEVWFANIQKRFTLANPSALQEFGFVSYAEEIDIEKLAASLEVYRPDGSPRPVEEAPPLRALKGEVVRNQEEIIRTPASGELRHRQVNSAPVRDAMGNIIGSVSVVRDITERKRAESEIQSLAKFPSENPNPILRIARDGTLLYVNEAGLSHLSEWRLRAGQEVPIMLREVVSQTMDNGSSQVIDLKHSERVYSFFIAPIVDADYANLYARDITDHNRAEEELRSSHEQLRFLARRLQSIREEERTEIAREIHDELGQSLTGLKIDLSWLTKKFRKDQKLLIEKAESMLKLLDTTIQMVRKISTELRPGVLDDLGLIAAIEWQMQDFQNRKGIKCEFNSSLEEVALDRDCSTAVFRIFQETLTNVARHARANKVRIDVEVSEGHLILKVEDNGWGIRERDILNPKSLGLLGMRERAFLFGGEVKITGEHGKGTTVTLKIPLSNAEHGMNDDRRRTRDEG